MPDIFKRLTNIVDITDYQYEGRDITQYYKARRKVQYFRPLFKEIDLVNRVKRIVGNPSISQAWLKMYEMLNEFKLFDPNKEEIKTFHFCEAPGNFISALEYFCKERTKVKKVSWSAQSLHPDMADIGDNYGYIKDNPTRWDFGENKTGNITRVPNIKHYATLTKDVDFITSDCGLAKKATMDVMKVYFAQITAILVCLPPGKNFIGKLVLFDSPAVFYAIHQVYTRFEHMFFYKNIINKQSFEFYLVGLNYKDKDEDQNNKMLKQLQNFEQEKFGEAYPTSFVRQMESIMTQLTNAYVFQTERWIYYMEHYEELETHKVKEIYHYISQKNDEWLEHVGLIVDEND
jgi:23S rRNA U2552 (ribose-2'-O)-methylase RlmE/FtsJ